MNDLTALNTITADPPTRYETGMEGLDKILGGGFVKGSTIMLSGQPGAGKSTLLLQVCNALSNTLGKKVLYIAGEENKEQIKMRADRLLINSHIVFLTEETEVEKIIEAVKESLPDLLIIDSLQMIHSPLFRADAGTPTQMRYSLRILARLAKDMNVTTVFVGHSTKQSGVIAGLLTLQHTVDVVLYLGLNDDTTRYLKANKNRFGAIDYIWYLDMTQKGLMYNPFPQMAKDGTFSTMSTITLSNKEIDNLLQSHPVWKPIVEASLSFLRREVEKHKITRGGDNL